MGVGLFCRACARDFRAFYFAPTLLLQSPPLSSIFLDVTNPTFSGGLHGDDKSSTQFCSLIFAIPGGTFALS